MAGHPSALVPLITGPFSSLSEPQLERFADMMSSSNPWLQFGYSKLECREKLSTPRYQSLIASAADLVLGILCFAVDGDLGGPFIRYVLIDPSQRSRGIGSSLIRNLLGRYKGKSCYLTVSESNEQAKHLYERLGFVVIGSIPDYNFWGQAELIMRHAGRPKRESTQDAR